MNPMRDRLKAGKTVVGTAGSVFEDNMVMLADSGLDFILFDTQHSPVEPKEYKRSFDAIKGKPITPIMRVSANRAELICYALDLGARGIIVPMVNTKEEATAMVRACQYSPLTWCHLVSLLTIPAKSMPIFTTHLVSLYVHLLQPQQFI